MTETIDHLDEDVPCFMEECDEEATWLVIWQCKCHHFVCQRHRDALIENQQYVTAYIIVRCTQCAKIIDAKKTEVLPL